MKIFFSVGEPSGDLHGANLIHSLRQRHADWEYVGYGGPRMAAAGCQLQADLTQLAVMWVAQAVLHLRRFLQLVAEADTYFRQQRPDLVVLIDYPGFNWWIARKAKAAGIPVVYYGTPQLWAWASWRVRKMRRLVDHVLCKLPFEETWFRRRGCQATFVGHPYFDELATRQLDAAFVEKQRRLPGPLVTILPGSRDQEVAGNLPTFLQAAAKISEQIPTTRFAIAVYQQSQVEHVQQLVRQVGLVTEVHTGRTAELIESATCCLACSGSVSLELLYHAKPSAILYRISRLGYVVQWMFRKVRYITLVNLLTAPDPFAECLPLAGTEGHQPLARSRWSLKVAPWAKIFACCRGAGNYDPADPRDEHVLMPEYLTHKDCSQALAQHLTDWLADDALRGQVVSRLEQLTAEVAHGGASERAADYISRLLLSPPAAAA